MSLVFLEALAALALLLFVVWWTMFSGRKSGERVADEADDASSAKGPDQP